MAKSAARRAPKRGTQVATSGTITAHEGDGLLTHSGSSKRSPSCRRLANPIARIAWERSPNADRRGATNHRVASEVGSTNETARAFLDDGADLPIDIRAIRSWAPFRAVLGSLGCPNRLPELCGAERLYWEDEGDLPTHLLTTAPGRPVTVNAMATAPGVHHVLRAYADGNGPIILLALSETEFGREMSAWICVDQREATQILMEEAHDWPWIGLKFLLSASEAPDDGEAIEADRAEFELA